MFQALFHSSFISLLNNDSLVDEPFVILMFIRIDIIIKYIVDK